MQLCKDVRVGSPEQRLLGGYPVLAGEREGNEMQQSSQRGGRKQHQACVGL